MHDMKRRMLAASIESLTRSTIRDFGGARSRPELNAGDELDWIEDSKAPQPHDVAETHLVYDVIAALSADFRDALVAVDVAGLSYHQAARALRIREATLTTRLFRARQRVARALRDETPVDSRAA